MSVYEKARRRFPSLNPFEVFCTFSDLRTARFERSIFETKS